MQLQLVHDVKLPAPAKQNFSVHLKSETGVRVGAIGLLVLSGVGGSER